MHFRVVLHLKSKEKKNLRDSRALQFSEDHCAHCVYSRSNVLLPDQKDHPAPLWWRWDSPRYIHIWYIVARNYTHWEIVSLRPSGSWDSDNCRVGNYGISQWVWILAFIPWPIWMKVTGCCDISQFPRPHFSTNFDTGKFRVILILYGATAVQYVKITQKLGALRKLFSWGRYTRPKRHQSSDTGSELSMLMPASSISTCSTGTLQGVTSNSSDIGRCIPISWR